MNRNLKWIALLTGLIVLIGGASILYDRLSGTAAPPAVLPTENETVAVPGTESGAGTEETAGAQERTAAPDFTVYDADGGEVKLSDFAGTPVVLNFWASWCPPCKSEMPDFDEAYREYGGRIAFVMVNMIDGQSETAASAQAFLAEQDFAFSVYFDTDMDAAMTYGVTSLPTTYFITAEGELAAYARGAIDRETLELGIAYIYDAE